MRIIFLVVFTTICTLSFAQLSADPAVGNIIIVDKSGKTLPKNSLELQQLYYLKIPVYNFSQAANIPSGSCRLIVDLGDGLHVDTTQLPLMTYFNWNYKKEQGHLILIGNLSSDFPMDYSGEVVFQVKGTSKIKSIAKVNFQVISPELKKKLTDEDLFNNTASIDYSVVTSLK